MPDISKDPAVVQVASDAKALGAQMISDARDAAHAILGHVAGAAVKDLPDLEAAALNVLYDFIPGFERSIVQSVVGGIAAQTEAKVNPEVVATVQAGLGIALQRIDAVLGTPK